MLLKPFQTHKEEGYHSNKYDRYNDAKDNPQGPSEKKELKSIEFKHQ